MKLKDNIIYNRSENTVMVKTNGDKIVIICNSEDQMDKVHDRFKDSGNYLIDFEVWDEGEDQKYIITYQVSDDSEPVYN
jgi:Rad3-related DNA helicase|tara:strand:+ start:1314 stop:1550 length:237 start_codon:yes stop_codon:yes gene_type:complete